MARKKKEPASVELVEGPRFDPAVDAFEVSVGVPPAHIVAASPPPAPAVPEGPYDANAALYKDRSGPGTKDVLSEGAANFAFHTAQARSETP